NRGFTDAAPPTSGHTGGHMRNRETPVRRHHQCTSRAADSRHQLTQDHHRRAMGTLSIRETFAYRPRHRQAYDALTKPRHGHSPGAIVRIDSASDQRRIPDTARQHGINSSGGRAGGNVAPLVQGHRANGSMPISAHLSLRKNPLVRDAAGWPESP